MSTKTQGVTTEIVTITPQVAHQLLGTNTNNRHENPKRVKAYSNSMTRGEWELNGDAIRVGQDGTLLDGQHRLSAVIESGVSIKVVLVTGLSSESRDTIDIGRKRTLGDILKINGEKKTALLAGTINLLWSYSNIGIIYSGAMANQAITPAQALQFLEDYPDVREHTQMPIRITKMLTPSVACALDYLFASVDKLDAEMFWYQLDKGTGIDEGDAIFALRERLQREMLKSQGRISATVRAALTVKAFNLYREGKPTYSLKWVGGGARQEIFPRVIGAKIVPQIDKP